MSKATPGQVHRSQETVRLEKFHAQAKADRFYTVLARGDYVFTTHWVCP